ncbi:MAG: hypothetical protein ACKPKO_50930, partial [Candidatus Fonsibacter sp.]
AHTNEAARVHAAMQLRENMTNNHDAMSRAQLQRTYAIILCLDVYARAHGLGQANAMNIAADWPRLSGYMGINSGLAGLTVAFCRLSSISLRDLLSSNCSFNNKTRKGRGAASCNL